MKNYFYHFLYQLLSGLSNRFPHKMLIRYKFLIGGLLLNVHAGALEKTCTPEREPEISINSLLQDSSIVSPKDTGMQIVKGYVMGEFDNSPVPYATIVANGTSIATVSDGHGYFSLKIPVDVKTLTISYIGYKEVTILVEPVVRVIMKEDDAILCYEVIVVNYKKPKIKKEKKEKKSRKNQNKE